MTDKIAAHFRESRRTSHSFQRLKQCKGCGNFSALWSDRCLQCGAEGRFLELAELSRVIVRRSAQRDMLLIGAASLTAMLFARDMTGMAVSLLAGAALAAAYYFIRKPYLSVLRKRMIQELLEREDRAIRDGLLRDIEDAASDLKADDFKLAYEKLREVGYLVAGNQVKMLKLMCLNHFNLRKDMDLELGTLVPDDFEPEFIRYLFEVSRVSPELVKRNVIDYTLRYRMEIEALAGGRAVIGAVVIATLRVNAYVVQYQRLIADYIDELPRERLLRLFRLTSGQPAAYPELAPKVAETANRKYGSDPEFQGPAASPAAAP
ncbi:hypothetical protein [Paenibacillus piri]|uniref:Uncharacterized protein n=1 Tax=Paenibacillus piri TaxID=2547395 RepID=A0A4R5KF84_9BACL|nr:hypothetical protein [Paenibacillus piri]TDF94079.1 hypothetical protein E1757_24595 [Paenibacillus piri]